MSDKISERIKKGLEIRNMKQSELVEKTGIGKSSISTYLSGDYEPKQKNIYKIAKALNVNEAWLMGHDVPMEKPHYVKVLDEISTNKLSQNEVILLENYNKLNDLGKGKAIERVTELTMIPTYTNESLEEIYTTMAAHNDNLDNNENKEADSRILEALKKRQK